MKKLMLVATLLVAGTSISFAQDTKGNDYNSNNDSSYNYDHRYGSQINSGYSRDNSGRHMNGDYSRGNHRSDKYNNDYRTSYRSGSCCGGNYRSSNRKNHNGGGYRNDGHRNNYNY